MMAPRPSSQTGAYNTQPSQPQVAFGRSFPPKAATNRTFGNPKNLPLQNQNKSVRFAQENQFQMQQMDESYQFHNQSSKTSLDYMREQYSPEY